jgi:2-keto-4-pentenoate hydratase
MHRSLIRFEEAPRLNADSAPAVTPVEIARRFVEARLAARALPAYPGPLPADLSEAYARQDAAIELWPDQVAGWKVGKIPADWVAVVGEDRLVGPIFAANVQQQADGQCLPIALIENGFAAVEAEYIFVIGRDLPAERIDWSAAEAADWVSEMRIGIEFAGSPLATINHLGPRVVVSDFGNNAGLLLGPVVDGWRARTLESLSCATFVADQLVGRGGAAFISGGPLQALAFAMNRCARRGRPLRAGDLISTGASTGIHDIRIGETARVEFAGGVVLHCVAERAQPRPELSC